MKPGDRIRITETLKDYKYFSVGDEAVVKKVRDDGSLLCDFNTNEDVLGDGKWWIGDIVRSFPVEYEVIEIYRPGFGVKHPRFTGGGGSYSSDEATPALELPSDFVFSHRHVKRSSGPTIFTLRHATTNTRVHKEFNGMMWEADTFNILRELYEEILDEIEVHYTGSAGANDEPK